MGKKSTQELEHILQSTHPEKVAQFLEDETDNMMQGNRLFSNYIHNIIQKKGLTQQEVFIKADLPERYGYKLLSEEKRTKQRDYILRICYAANMTLDETQKALTIYGMAPLYARIPRDAVLMIAFNQHSGDLSAVNALLNFYKMDPLRTCGKSE